MYCSRLSRSGSQISLTATRFLVQILSLMICVIATFVGSITSACFSFAKVAGSCSGSRAAIKWNFLTLPSGHCHFKATESALHSMTSFNASISRATIKSQSRMASLRARISENHRDISSPARARLSPAGSLRAGAISVAMSPPSKP